MTAERDSMTLNEVSVPALGVEERSDEAPRAGRVRPTPDPEVVAKPKRRQFTAEYRLRVLEEADRCTQPGEVGRLLRREGLYSSHLTAWRKARRKGSLRELAAKKRGAKPAERNPLDAKLRALEAQVARLEHELHTAHTILDVQEPSLPQVSDPRANQMGRASVRRSARHRLLARRLHLAPRPQPRRSGQSRSHLPATLQGRVPNPA